MIAFLALLVLLFMIVVGVEAIARVRALPIELTRKATHILTGVTVALSVFYIEHVYLIVLSVMFLLVIALSRKRSLFRSIHDPERSGVGELWYPMGILLAALFFPEPTIFMYAVLILAVSDGLAGLIGKFFGKRRIPGIQAPKTYLGTSVFIVTAFGLSLLVMSPGVALIAAVSLAALELLSLKGLDNLILPLAAGVIAVVLG